MTDCDDVDDCGATDVCTESGLDEAATEAAGEDAADVDECSDGQDDDGDGMIDCKDDDCATDEACLEQDRLHRWHNHHLCNQSCHLHRYLRLNFQIGRAHV